MLSDELTERARVVAKEYTGDDSFTEAMWQHMQTVNREMTNRLNELRDENRELRHTISQFPATCWMLQEQVTMLEQKWEKSYARHGH